MAKIDVIQKDKVSAEESIDIVNCCPFGAIDYEDGYFDINSGCKLCKICTRQYPEIFEYVETTEVEEIDKTQWNDITVYVEHLHGEIHPVTFELLAKAREMADKIGHDVKALFVGHHIQEQAEQLFHYGADEVFVYDYPQLYDYRVEPYAAVFEDHIQKEKPTVVLVGGTTIGRSLAPRVAARFRTGLTADCTSLDINENTDLDQIRPAFGGNVMAHIQTPNNRPQFATVRYKIFNALEEDISQSGILSLEEIDEKKLESKITVLSTIEKPKAKAIEDAEVLVVAGRGVKKEEDLQYLQELADKLGGMLAVTRPLVEAGWADAKQQIGLSGRTVKPKLIITCGVSGAVQFIAGMKGSDQVYAINTDPNAPIFSVANYSLIGDLYDIVPQLIQELSI